MRALLCAAIVCLSSAWGLAGWAATTRGHDAAAQAARKSTAEAARAKALKAKAQAAARQAAALKSSLAAMSAKASETEAAARQAESDAAALDAQRRADLADQARTRRTLDIAIAALLQGEAAAQAPPSAEDARAGALAALAAAPLIEAVNARQSRIAQTALLGAEKQRERAALQAASVKLAMDREAAAAQLDEQARRRAALLAEAQRAARRAADLARRARSLQDLADKVSTPRAAGRVLGKSSTGPRMAPAAGRIVIAYGDKTAAGPARGVTIETAPGAKVVAPAAATVAYSDPFRSYGQVLILDQGGGGALVLTGLQTALAPPGKKVALGEVVGVMGSSFASTAPDLYFEVREAGRTVNPEQWLKARP